MVFFAAAALASLPGARAIGADGITWQVPLYASLPSAELLSNTIATRDATGTELLVVGAGWIASGNFNSELATRVIALDRRDGSRHWQTELNEACAIPPRELKLNRLHLFAMPDGDIGVAMDAQHQGIYPPYLVSACYARLSADGRILWARTDKATSPAQSFTVHTLRTFRNGDFAVAGLHGRRFRTTRLSAQDGRVLWSSESDFQHSDRTFTPKVALLEVDPATDDLVLLNHGDSSDAPPAMLSRVDGRNGRTIWHQSWCADSYWTGRLAPTKDRGVAFSLECTYQEFDEFRFGIADGAGASDHRLPFPRSHRPISFQHGPTGDVFAVGGIEIDGTQSAIARVSAASGRILWTVPDSIGGPNGQGFGPNLPLAVSAAGLFVWEPFRQQNVYSPPSPMRLTRFDPDDGHLVDQRDIPLAAAETLRVTQMSMLPDGSLFLSALPWGSQFAGGWFWLSTIGADLDTEWLRREPVAAEHAVLTGTARGDFDASPLTVPTKSGPPGLLVATLAIGDVLSNDLPVGEPVVHRLARSDGRSLWRWRPQDELPYAPARLHAFASDGDSYAYAAGRFTAGAREPFITRIDVADGRTRWQISEPVLSLARHGADALYTADETGVSRLSPIDGRSVWRIQFAEDMPTTATPSVAVGPDGNPIVALASPGGPLHVLKLAARDGHVLWTVREQKGYAPAVQLATLADGDVVISSPPMRLRRDTGEVVWRRDALATSGMQISADGRIAFRKIEADSSPATRAILDAATGATLWSENLSAFESTYPYLPLAFDRDGSLLVVNASEDDFRVRRVSPSDASAREMARIGSANNRYGRYLEGRSPKPTDLAVDIDGSVYFLADLENEEGGPLSALVTKAIRIGGADGPDTPAWKPRHDARPLPPLLRSRPDRVAPGSVP